ncbi:PREDICTED: inter-alpha-trypsin inhibitor heavy chain H3, partial [Myotis davidii]|uniref:inter-alpha-trypsin inhibitor heavy chain H3 n=1 Tax=Myotis davidii TaxID=225400 RepID=UPI0007675202
MAIVNGYFVHFFAPRRLPVVPKNVVFVIDISGSMYGRKIQQTKDALLKILEDKKEEDYLNFILFDSDVTTWKDTLVQATPENIQEAREFVKNIRDRGMTNINDGLLTGISMLNKAQEEHTVPDRSTSIVIMLTDGHPNTGESRPAKIQENVLSAIGGRFPLYTLGFGNNLNYNFLESLALENDGFARRIYEDSDANLQLQGFYEEVANPLLTAVEVEYPENAILDLTRNTYQHFYDGSEIVVAGRLVDEEMNNFKADVKGHGALTDLTFTEEVDLKEMEKALQEQDYIFGSYIERLWAYLTIEQLLDKRLCSAGAQEEDDLATPGKCTPGPEEAVTAATAYQTSYQPPSSPYYYVDGDPHFIIQVRGKKDAICFNIDEEPGTVLRLIQDPITGLIVNGQIIGDKGNSSNSKNRKTYFGKMGIVNSPMDLRIEVTTEKITLQNGAAQSTFSWLDTVTVTSEGFSVKINREAMVVSFGEGITFKVVLHQVWKKHHIHLHFLGFYVLDSDKMSTKSHGLLGQFFRPLAFQVSDLNPGNDPSKIHAIMLVKKHRLAVT